jgi:HEAT repeat protein
VAFAAVVGNSDYNNDTLPGTFTMHRLPLLSVVALGLVLLGPARGRADYSPEQYKADVKLCEDAKLAHTDAALLDFLRKRLPNPEDEKRIAELVNKLGSPSFKVREQATAELIKAGPPVLPALRKVVHSGADLELAKRCDRCIKEIEKASPNNLVQAALRLLKARQVPGACTLVLEYLPFTPDEVVEEEALGSIYELALAGAKVEVLPPRVNAGKLDPAIVQALADKEAARRAIAALVLAQFGSDAQRAQVKKCLADADARVRFRAAQGLLAVRDASGIPVLIALLRDGPLDLALVAEDLLSTAANGKGPDAPLAEGAAAREKCQAAWQAWWDNHKTKVDLSNAELGTPFGGLGTRAGAGCIVFLDALFTGKKVLVKQTSDVPFTLGGGLSFGTREQLDAFFDMILNQPRPKEFKFKVTKVITAAEYIKTAPEEQRGFLEASRPAQVYVVFVQPLEGPGGGRDEVIPFFMRVSGGKAKCIGAGAR